MNDNYERFTAPLSHRICESFELPEDVCRNCGYLEIISNTCALADGCRAVLEYDDSLIKLDLGKLTVAFRGNSLTIKSLSMKQALVEGFIVSVEFGN